MSGIARCSGGIRRSSRWRRRRTCRRRCVTLFAGAAVKLAREAGYANAGTVEFLLDVDRNEWFFIEVNPRVQVEHTVTETVVGIDIVQSQILIAQGFRLHEPPLSLPEQKDVNVRGFALQCRITTEDPESQFAPDYGRITTYRSPAGLGIRLDGATAYAGSVINPYYDSLLVKMTAWHNTLDGACHRADRALREFRIRGVKTNIPFLLNVVNHPAFQSGEVTTSFLDRHSELFAYKKPQDRATRLLRYIASVIVNGNATVKGETGSERLRGVAGGRFRAGRAAAAGDETTVAAMGLREICGLGAGPETVAPDGHNVPRRASVPTGDARSDFRSVANIRRGRAPLAQPVQPRNVGWGDFRRLHAVPA